jgi:parallel beta-helix repeat protein
VKIAHSCAALGLLAALLLAAAPAAAKNPYKGWTVVEVEDGPDVLEDLKTAFATAQPGTIIQLPKATIPVDAELEIASSHVLVKGRNPKRTILDFSSQVSGGQGILISGDHVTLENFTVRDTPGDGIRVQRVAEGDVIEELVGVTFRKLKVEWTSPNDAEHGAYGLYPVNSRDILVEKTEIIGASDAGIYVGQSNNIIVTKNKVHGNVAGIEIENSNDADVFKNTCWDNTGAILVFNHPNLSQTGSRTRVFKNKMTENNHPNFGTGTVGQVPAGTGVIVLANDYVEIFKNKFYGHDTGAIEMASHDLVEVARPFDPWPEALWIHDNKYKDNGAQPDLDRPLGIALDFILGGGRDILWDQDVDEDKLVDGELPLEFRICIDEKKFTYGSGNILAVAGGAEPMASDDPSPHLCDLESLVTLPEITIPDAPPAP